MRLTEEVNTMKNLMRTLSLSAMLGVVTLASAILGVPSLWAQASLPVKITNTPLPIQGSVNAVITNASVPVSGTVNVNSLPAVQLSGTPTVTVGNAETSPVLTRDVDRPSNEPFSPGICMFNDFDGVNPCESNLHSGFVVPSTTSGKTVKRMVIEFVSGSCEMSRSDTFLLSLELGIDATLASGRTHYLVPVSVPNVSGGPNFYAIAQQTRIFVNPGQTVSIGAGLRGASADQWDMVCHFQVEGSLITQ
jgi:hypothetical protein